MILTSGCYPDVISNQKGGDIEMSRSKKFIIIGVVGALLLVASIGGVAYAQAGEGEGPGAMLDKVCEIYQQNTGTTINQQALKDAFAQAREEMRPPALPAPQDRPQMDPEAMKDRLQNLVTDGKITQAQADEFTAWLNAKPDTTSFEQQLQDWQEGRPEMPAEMKAWLEAKPDIPFGFGPPGHGKFPGPRGFGGPCAPAE